MSTNDVNPEDESLESISEAARRATAAAFRETLAAGGTVVIAEEGGIYEIHPDGSRRFIEPAPPSVPVSELKPDASS